LRGGIIIEMSYCGVSPYTQVWQYAVIAYVVTCIGPFCPVLLIGPGLLRDRLISLRQFFVATIIPLPFLFYWLWVRLRSTSSSSASRLSVPTPPETGPRGNTLGPDAKAMLQILQGPFKETTIRRLGPICGQVREERGTSILNEFILLLH